MKGTENKILSLATQAFEQRISLNAVLRDHVSILIDKGIPLSDVIDSQVAALSPGCPSLLCSHIAKICAEIGARGSPRGLAIESLPSAIVDVLSPSAIHLAVANSLDDRSDRQSLQLATEHYGAARRWLEPATEEHAGALLQEGDARRRLAELGVDPLYNLTKSIECAQQARRTYAAGSRSFGVAEMNEGIAHDLLANLGVSPREHLETAVRLYNQARSVFHAHTEEYASTQFNEAASCIYLAELGVNPIQLLKAAVSFCEDARKSLPRDSQGFGLVLLNEGQARRGLAEWQEEPIKNLRTAVLLLHQAQTRFTPQDYDWLLAVEGEAGALRDLAERGVAVIANLNAALELARSLNGSYAPATLPQAQLKIFQADLYVSLARMGVTPEENLTSAIELCQEARLGFDPTRQTHARALTTEGHTRILLAELGIRREENCRLALVLYEESEKSFAFETAGWAIARRNASRALWKLGLISEAYERLKSGLAILDVSRQALRTERERIAFGQSVSGQYQDAAAICLDGMAQAAEDQKAYWRGEAWHQVHRAKNRALLDLLRGGRPRLREHERTLWEDLEMLSRKLVYCDDSIRETNVSLARGSTAELLRQLDTLHQERSLLSRAVDAKRAQALRDIEGADTFLGVEAPPVERVRKELLRLAEQCGGSGQRSLLVEFFLLDTGAVLVFLRTAVGRQYSRS